MRALIALVLIAASLAGCSTSPERQQALHELRADVNAHLAAAPLCCEASDNYGSVSEFSGKADVAMTDDTPVKQFEEGRSHFLLLRVPEAASPFAMQIFEAPEWVERYGFIWPIVLLLDENYQVLKKDVADRMDDAWMSSVPYPSRHIDIDPTKHKYVVIYTDPALFGRETFVQWELGVATTSITAPYVPTGILRVAFHKKSFKCSMFYDSDSCVIKSGEK